MALHLWIGFALAYLATTLSPGPNVLLVIRNSVRFGRSSAAMTILGNLLAQLLVVLLVACGVGAVIAALPPFFLVLKMVGAGYLIWLGVRQISTTRACASVCATPTTYPHMSQASILRQAFLVSCSNPKTLIFLSAFMPQFIDQSRPLAGQFALMYLTISATVLCVHFSYSLTVSRLESRMRNHGFMRAIKYLGGSLFVLLGLRLMASER